MTDVFQLTSQCLRIDRVTGEVVAALRDAGIPSLLLKGPVHAARLYDDGAFRPYVDSDLLVDPDRFAPAEELLLRRGFVRGSDEERLLPEWAQHGHELIRPGERICVELHWTLMHLGAPPPAVWQAFTRGARRQRVGGVSVDVPGDPQIALHTAVHVAEHGALPTTAGDLTRAIVRLPFTVWVAAADLARELDATRAFAAGLWLLEGGRPLARRLGFGPDAVTAFALERLERAPTRRAKTRLALEIAFPSPTYMRSFGRPLARRGRAGLIAAYVWRPAELAARFPGVLRARRPRPQRTASR